MRIQDDRQFLAVFVADVAGYSRLMTINESRTVQELRECQALLAAIVEDFGGYIVDKAGDGVLAAFPSVVRAVECALSIQQAVAEMAAGQAPDERMWLRIGINPGEVIKQDGRIFGDAVNIAARIAAIADPGAIAVSAIAHDQVRGKVRCAFDDLGVIALRNIDNPPRLYRVRPEESSAAERPQGAAWPVDGQRARAGDGEWTEVPDGIRPGVITDLKKLGPLSAWSRSRSLSITDRTRAAAQARVLLCVQKFVTLGGGDALETFALGLEEDLISEFSDDREVTVREGPPDARQNAAGRGDPGPGMMPGTMLLLSGSLQQKGSSLRVHARLVDLATGDHVWSERYEGEPSTDFQVAVSGFIVSAVRLKLMFGKFNLRDKAPADAPAVREIVNRAIVCFFQQTKESVMEAVQLSERALAIDPGSIRGRRTLSAAISAGITLGALPRTDENLARALIIAQEVVLAAPYDEIARCELAWALTNVARHAEAVEHLRRAVELNPASPNARADLAEQLVLLGDAEGALEELQQAFALSRYDPLEVWRHNTMALARFILGEYEEALEVSRNLVRAEPAFVRGAVNWAASAAALEFREEAGRAVSHLAKVAPGLRLSTLSPTYTTSFVKPEHQQRFLGALRKAGVPE